MSPRITLSQTALQEIQRLKSHYCLKSSELEVSACEDLVLMIAAVSGGCMQWHYGLFFVTNQNSDGKDNLSIAYEDIELRVPEASQHLLDGLHIDYSDDLMGGGFRFSNPNAMQTCGCGSSFSNEVTTQEASNLHSCT